MGTLHVESDQLHLTARSLWQAGYQFADQLYVLRAALYRLEMGWQGGEAEDYLHDLITLLGRLNARMDELHALGLCLARQAEAWDECDQRWTGTYRESGVQQPGE